MSGNYDRIARFYDVDMARNMAFDDVGFYTALCRRSPGRVLELGCGNGRILVELIVAGVDAIGVDASHAMLERLRERAAARSVTAPICQMDVRALGLRPGFEAILCPYSLVTYLTADEDLDRLLTGARHLLKPGGLLVVDAFVPRPVTPRDDFRLDYRRPFGDHFLVRSKRIAALGRGMNRIERRYQVLDADGVERDRVDVAEDIRPYPLDELRVRVVGRGFIVDEVWWDYASTAEREDAQFFTLVARTPSMG